MFRAAFRPLLLALTLVTSSACGVGIIRETAHGSAEEVTGRQTFAVAVVDNQDKNVSDTDDHLTSLVGTLVVAQAELLGYQQVAMQVADLVIAVDIVVTGFAEFRNFQSTSFRGAGMDSNLMTQTYEEGLLVFDFIDVKAKSVLWRTSVKTRVSNDVAKGLLETLVEDVMHRIAPAQSSARVQPE